MPVTKSAKKALRTSSRRHEENLITKELYKKAVKSVKKAIASGSDQLAATFSTAQSALDTAAKRKTIHPNKAARLKSRLAKKVATPVAEVAPKAKKSSSAAAGAKKKAAAKKTTAKKK